MRRPAFGRAIATAIILALGAAAWAAGVTNRFFDYDEIYHAHATWLIAHGDRPFHEFQASHTPFLWYPFAAMWQIAPDSSRMLLPLRVVAALGTLASIVWMAATWKAVRPGASWIGLTLGIAMVAFDRDIVDYALEFRPDGWAAALLFFALFLGATDRPRPLPFRCATFATLAGLAVFASPKLLMLPVLFVGVDLLARVPRRAEVVGALAGYVVGAFLALAAAAAFLRAVEVDLRLTRAMAVDYQWAFERNSGFRQGLLRSVMDHPWLLLLVSAGIAAWAVGLKAERRRPHAFEVSLLLFLAVQLAIVGRPYKQYYGPWFLMAAGFVSCLALVVQRARPTVRGVSLALVIAAAGWTSWNSFSFFAGQDQAQRMIAFFETLTRLSGAGSSIVAYPPLHPVVRRDVFYGWSRTIDPQGYGTEAIMRDLAVSGYSERFERSYYRQELDASPPALIVSPLAGEWAYEPEQWAALQEYLGARRDGYLLLDRGLLRPVWIRKDRVDAATLQQLTGGFK